MYLIEDGQTIFLWVGRDAVPQLVQDVFDLPSYADLRGGKVSFKPLTKCNYALIYATFSGLDTSAGQLVLAPIECDHLQGPRDASGRLPTILVYRQRRRRTGSAFVGSQRSDPRPRRFSPELPTIFDPLEGQGMNIRKSLFRV